MARMQIIGPHTLHTSTCPFLKSMSFSPNPDNDSSSSFPRTSSSASLVNLTSYFNRASDRETDDWPGLTLLDTVETFFDARIDLFERNLKKQRDRLQFKATTLAKGKIRTNTEELDKELQKFKIKVYRIVIFSTPDTEHFHRYQRGLQIYRGHGIQRKSLGRKISYHFSLGFVTYRSIATFVLHTDFIRII